MRVFAALLTLFALTASAEPLAPIEIRAPEFPEAAVKARMHGQVQVAVKIAADGSVASAAIVTSLAPLLDRASLEAAQAWRYPSESGGEARTATLSFVFTLREDPPGEQHCFVGPAQVTVVLPGTVRVQGWLRSPSLTTVSNSMHSGS
jgi:TonB family protein